MARLGDLHQFKNKLARTRTRIELRESLVLDDRLANIVIDALRLGTAPIRGAALLVIGRESIIDGMRGELDSVSAGGSALRLLNGDYGIGKTLTLRVLQDYAFQQGFATSFVTLSPRECPLYDLRAVYQHIVKGIRVNECRDMPALEWVLESWARRVKTDVQNRGSAPWSFWKLGLPFKEALTVYFEAAFRDNFVLAEKALSWIHGDIASSRDARQIGVSEAITSANALQMLGNLTKMIRELGLRGLVILLDEAETIPSVCGVSRRIEAYNNLGKLSNAAGSTPFSYFVYATTPIFFQYLADSSTGTAMPSRKITTIGNPSPSEFMELALLIRDLYLQAYGWKGDRRVEDGKLRTLVSACLARFKDSVTPRLVVRTVVKSLDLCHENPGLSFQDVVEALEENVNRQPEGG